MIYIVVILIFICLAFVSGYLLFSYIRKRADKEREVNNSNLKYVEDLRRNVIQQFDVIISTLSPKFDAQIINLNLIKNNKKMIRKEIYKAMMMMTSIIKQLRL